MPVSGSVCLVLRAAKMAQNRSQSSKLLLLLLFVNVLHTYAVDALVGCYKDGPRRVLPTQVFTDIKLTVTACSEAATSRGQPLFGLKGNECWIGESPYVSAAATLKGSSSSPNARL